jgi:hypothetical protein
MFETGDSILVESPFKLGDKEYSAGIYLLNSINAAGTAYLNGKSLTVGINILTKARFIKIDPVKNKKEAALI